jgi:iron complex transport system ATP-binding protein
MNMESLVLRSLSWSADDIRVIDNVNANFQPGRITGLVGPSGAGKTTLLRLIAHLQPHSNGQVLFNGVDTTWLSARNRARLMALVESDASTDAPLSVRDTVALGRYPYHPWSIGPSSQDTTIVERALARVGLADLAERRLSSLSQGERQKVHLARALAQEPQLLLLDEPTSHLDIGSAMHIARLLKDLAAEGITIVAALHDLNLAISLCDESALLDRGRLVATGPPEDVLSPTVVGAVYGVKCSAVVDPNSDRPVLVFSR